MQYGTAATVFTALFIAITIVLNMGVSFLTERYSLKANLNDTTELLIGEDTKNLIGNLDREIQIYVLRDEIGFKKDDYGIKIGELLSRYENSSNGKIKVQYIDPDKNPSFAKNYSDTTLSLGTLIVESDLRNTIIPFVNLFVTEISNNALLVKGSAAEQRISSAINYVISDTVTKSAYIIGHNEQQLTGLEDVMSVNNYEVDLIDLASEEIPDDIDNLIISSPGVDYTAEEIKKLDTFLAGTNKKLYVFFSYTTPKLETLERYLTEWGVEFQHNVVLDMTDSISGQGLQIFAQPAGHDLTSTLNFGQRKLVMPAATAITPLWEEKSYRTCKPILSSGSNSYAKTMSVEELITNFSQSSSDEKGPFTIGTVSTHTKYVNEQKVQSQVFCIGSSGIADISLTSMDTYLNNSFLNALISYNNTNTNLDIQPVTYSDSSLQISGSQARVILIALIALPILILILGVIVFIRRKNR